MDYGDRNRVTGMSQEKLCDESVAQRFRWNLLDEFPGNGHGSVMDRKLINREILLSFWKIHILHHAAEGEVVGQWMLKELAHHGYEVSPGTLYPLLKRLEKNGWLKSKADPDRGPKAPRAYRITAEGRKVLQVVRQQLRELGVEVAE